MESPPREATVDADKAPPHMGSGLGRLWGRSHHASCKRLGKQGSLFQAQSDPGPRKCLRNVFVILIFATTAWN